MCSVIQLCPILCNTLDCSPPGSSVHGILQARILEWVAISFSRGSSRPRDWKCISRVSCIAGGFFTCWTIWEAQVLIFLRSQPWRLFNQPLTSKLDKSHNYSPCRWHMLRQEKDMIGWTWGKMQNLKSLQDVIYLLCRVGLSWDPVSLTRLSVHEISQARILEWVAISSSRESSHTQRWTGISCIGRHILYHWATLDIA